MKLGAVWGRVSTADLAEVQKLLRTTVIKPECFEKG
jgi:hypothetical protein